MRHLNIKLLYDRYNSCIFFCISRAPLSNRRDTAQSEYSCPPSYRSQTSSTRPATISLQNNSIIHSREHSLSISESNHGGSVINVVNIINNGEEDIALDNITIDSLKLEPESDVNQFKMLLKSGNNNNNDNNTNEIETNKNDNLVTIVQTNEQHPVIVTVSGSSQSEVVGSSNQIDIPTEMEILAHL